MLLPGVGPKMATLVCKLPTQSVGKKNKREEGGAWWYKENGEIPSHIVFSHFFPPSFPPTFALAAYGWGEVVGICVDTHVHRIRYAPSPILCAPSRLLFPFSSYQPPFLTSLYFSSFPSLPPSLLQQPPRLGQHLELPEPEGPESGEDTQAPRVVDAAGELGGGTCHSCVWEGRWGRLHSNGWMKGVISRSERE